MIPKFLALEELYRAGKPTLPIVLSLHHSHIPPGYAPFHCFSAIDWKTRRRKKNAPNGTLPLLLATPATMSKISGAFIFITN
jgi:hypothetical protein